MPLLYLALSYHGFGHIAQTAPVVNALRRRRPALRLVIQSAAPVALLQSRFEGPFTLVERAPDFGMKMANSLDVLPEASHRAYAALHADWAAVVQAEWSRIAAHRPSALLANVPYLPLAAAALGALPAAALCSLNWAEIHAAYAGDRPGATHIQADMRAAYDSARMFITPAPSMPMPGLKATRAVGPIARVGRAQRARLRRRLALPADARVVLVFLGGVRTPLPVHDWPLPAGLHWLLPAEQCIAHPRVHAIEQTGMPYEDLLCSVDALVTKPGYGSFTDAVCNGVPTLYVRRGDWPEEPSLVAWLRREARCAEISRASLESGLLAPALEALWSAPPRPPVPPDGVEQAADLLESLL